MPTPPPLAPSPGTEAPATPRATAAQFRALCALVLVLGVLAMHTTRTLLAVLVVAAWFAGLTAPLVRKLASRMGGRPRVAALATFALVLIIVLPVVLLAFPLAGMLREIIAVATRESPAALVQRWIAAAGVSGGAGVGGRLVDAVRQAVPNAPGMLSRAFGALSSVVVQLFVLVLSAYYFSAAGGRLLSRLRDGSPLASEHFDRLVAEFMAVARAMLVGELLTALVQGVMAGVIYAILGVPSALFFAVLTGFVSLLPTIGTALVWVPLCGVLLAAGRGRDAAILAVLGVAVIGTVDNVLRPFFGKLGANQVHPLLVFLGIFGGLEVFGGWGLVLGPLVLALFVAAYRIYADELMARRRAGEPV